MKVDDWNRVRLTFVDDEMQLSVNGKSAYTHKLIQSQRRLGLYYDAIESGLQVRNMKWTGDWPKQLPPPEDQELAGKPHESLDGLEKMQEFARIDFARPFDTTRFPFFYKDAKFNFTSDGLRVEPQVIPGWNSYRVEDKQRINGDFDATLRFSDLKYDAPTSQSDLILRFFDDHGNRYGTAMGARVNDERLVALKYMVLGKDNTKLWGHDHIGDDATDGTLRFVRRGDTVYSFIAYGDSQRFHFVGSRKLFDPASAMSLRMEVSRNEEAKISVVLHNLVIRTVPASEQKHDRRVKALGKIVHDCPTIVGEDLAKADTTDALLVTGQATRTSSVLTISTTNGASSIACQRCVSGDFDVGFDVGDMELADKARMTLGLALTDGTQCKLTIQRGDEKAYRMQAQSKIGETVNMLGEVELKSPQSLRLMRVQRTLFFVCAGESESRVIGFWDIGSNDIEPGAIKLSLSSESPTASAVVKTILVRSSVMASR